MNVPVGGYPHLTKELVKEILEAPASYGSDEEKEACQRMVESLTPEYRRTASYTSYAYWYALTYFEGDDKPCKEVALQAAMKEARRHLVACGNEEEIATGRLRECCQFREENHLELFRTCYQVLPDGLEKKEGTPEEEELKTKFRGFVEEELNTKQAFFVRGQDQDSRAVVVKMDRVSPETNPEAYSLTQLYIAERAIACTEFLSKGKEDKVVAVMDYANYSSSNAPPLMTMKDAVTRLQTNYPERLKTAIITEPPFWMRGIYNLLYPLMSQDTYEKVQMAYGEVRYFYFPLRMCCHQLKM